MVLPIALLVVWAMVTVPMALVLLMSEGKRRPAPRRAPVISIRERQTRDQHRTFPDAA